jgi:hypothetical protein
MKQVLFALLVLLVAVWTAPVFAQDASLLDQVKGKTEAEVIVFMGQLNNEQLASLLAEAINTASADPANAAAAALRNLVLSAGSKVLATKPADQYEAIVSAVQRAAPGTLFAKSADGALSIVPAAPAVGAAPAAAELAGRQEKEETSKLIDQKYDSELGLR